MKVFGIVGWKNSGKTELMVKLLHYFAQAGLPVSTIKHAHHDFDIDVPGKDSFRHRQAGAHEVLVASEKRYALIHENRNTQEPHLEELLAKLDAVSLVLVEGFKKHPHKKLEVVRGEQPAAPIALTDESVVAFATDTIREGIQVPQLDLGDTALIAQFILDETRLITA